MSNSDFQQFVKETKYVTEAERYGWSFVFEDLLSDTLKATWYNYTNLCGQIYSTEAAYFAPWWVKVEGSFLCVVHNANN